MQYLIQYINELYILSKDMAPYLLFGFLFAGALHIYFKPERVRKYLGAKNFKSVIYASLLGVPLPLCSCGVIPTGISFHKNGSSKGAAVSFLISTPQTGVDSILVTYSMIGLPFALLRPVVAMVTGVFGGWLTNKMETQEEAEEVVENNVKTAPSSKKDKFFGMFRYAFVEFMQDISTYLLFGLFLAALMAVLIPDDFFSMYIGNHFVEMAIVLVASVPLYICATGSVPIAAVLLLKGLSPGAALVLLMAGPATNAATITVIGKALGKRTLFAYLFSIIGGALVFGYLINILFPEGMLLSGLNLESHEHSNHIFPEWFNLLSVAVLGVLIANAYMIRYGIYRKLFPSFYVRKKEKNDINAMNVIVKGMTCNHCKNTVEKGISEIKGVKSVNIDLANMHVSIEGDEVDIADVENKVNDLGYEFKGKV
ncbi:MAG: heavy metal-associated domain-containing protein [Bacteroidetes bacterium]|nr:heavy metal-associated domain-containing protein [Bacteroidota bacterium]MBT6836519.1 heavy metal-associated domain-containing protein [Bacteroidota bacterium]